MIDCDERPGRPEDVPIGLTIYAQLGRQVGLEPVLMESVIHLTRALLGTDFGDVPGRRAAPDARRRRPTATCLRSSSTRVTQGGGKVVTRSCR